MLLPDEVSCYAVPSCAQIALYNAIYFVQLSDTPKDAFKRRLHNDFTPVYTVPDDFTFDGWADDVSDVLHVPGAYWMYCNIPNIAGSIILPGEAHIMLPTERENVLASIQKGCQLHTH